MRAHNQNKARSWPCWGRARVGPVLGRAGAGPRLGWTSTVILAIYSASHSCGWLLLQQPGSQVTGEPIAQKLVTQ